MGAGVSATALKQQETQLKLLQEQSQQADKKLAKQSSLLETTLNEIRVMKKEMETKTPEEKKEPLVDVNVVFKVERGLKIKEDVDRLKSVVDTLKLQLDSSADSVYSIFLSIQKKLEHLERERDELAEKLAQETSAKLVLRDSLTFQITNLETTVSKNIVDINSAKENSDNIIKLLQAEKIELQRKIDMLTIEQQNMKSAYDTKEKELHIQIEKLEREIARLTQIIAKKEEDFKNERSNTMSQINQLNTSIMEMKLTLQLEQKKFDEQLDVVTKQRDKLQRDLEALKLSSQVSDAELRVKISTVEEQNKKLIVDLDQMKSKDKDNTVIISDLKTVNISQAQEIELLKKKLQEAKEEALRLNIQLSTSQSSLSMMLRETDYYATHRSHTRLTSSISILEKKHETTLLEKYMKLTSGTKFITLKDFAALLLSMDILSGVTIPELDVVFPNPSIQCIGWIEILTAWKDVYSMANLYDQIAGSTSLNRVQLGKVFTDCGLRFFETEFKRSFDSIVRCVDKGGEEMIDKIEFLKICVLLLCFGMMFNYTDSSKDKHVALEELLKVMNMFGCAAIYVKSVESQFHLYAQKTDKNVISFEGFVGILLANIAN